MDGHFSIYVHQTQPRKSLTILPFFLTVFLGKHLLTLFPHSHLYPFYGALTEHAMHLHDSPTKLYSHVFSSVSDPELIHDQHCLSTRDWVAVKQNFAKPLKPQWQSPFQVLLTIYQSIYLLCQSITRAPIPKIKAFFPCSTSSHR